MAKYIDPKEWGMCDAMVVASRLKRAARSNMEDYVIRSFRGTKCAKWRKRVQRMSDDQLAKEYEYRRNQADSDNEYYKTVYD